MKIAFAAHKHQATMNKELREWLKKPIPEDDAEALNMLRELARISHEYAENEISLRPSQAYEILKLLKLIHSGSITEMEVANQAFRVAGVFHDDFKHLLDENEAQHV